jgi:aminoglycoside N3'-acetyltransferase/predicted nucleotidyltransferase
MPNTSHGIPDGSTTASSAPPAPPPVTAGRLRRAVRELGRAGRPLCVHASLRSFGRVQGGAPAVVGALLAEGCTVLVPAFSWETFAVDPLPHQQPARNGADFVPAPRPRPGSDRVYAPDTPALDRADMGAIAAAVLDTPGRVRGEHPLMSFAAVGPGAADLVAGQAPLDVFAPLRALAGAGGAVLLMGVGLERMTLLHLAEQEAGRVPFRRWANGPDGQPEMVAVGGCSDGFPNLEQTLGPLGQTAVVGRSVWRAFPARATVDAAVRAIRERPRVTRCAKPTCRCDDAIAGGPIPASGTAGMGPSRAALVAEIAEELRRLPGVVAVALGGSYAAGTARPDSDVDLGLYYREAAPFDIADVRRVAEALNDTPRPTVTGFGGWGKWVNGGAWLTVRGQRVDFLYRSVERLEHWIAESERGEWEQDYYVQDAYGFRSYIYLGELDLCWPLHDPHGVLWALKARVAVYPPALQAGLIRTWLPISARSFYALRQAAARGDVYMAVGCLTRIVAMLTQVLFALNGAYFVTDKGALERIESFPLRPPGYAGAVRELLGQPGATRAGLESTAGRLEALHGEVAALCAAWTTVPVPRWPTV